MRLNASEMVSFIGLSFPITFLMTVSDRSLTTPIELLAVDSATTRSMGALANASAP